MTCWTKLTDWQKIPMKLHFFLDFYKNDQLIKIIYNIQYLMILFVLNLGLFLLFEETTP